MFGGNGFGGFGEFAGGQPSGPWLETYRVNSMTMHDKEDKEGGDKIILPSSAFEKLARMHITYPMQFQLHNANAPVDLTAAGGSSAKEFKTHVGVLEFTAPEGKCFVPYWIMQNLMVAEGGFLEVKNVSLPLCKFIKFRPQTEDFLEISNPKAVLESILRNFSCMTLGDQICLPYNGRKYYLDVVELEPQNAVGIVETDVNVEFAPPPGYEEKLKARKAEADAQADALAKAALAQAQGGASASASATPPTPGSAGTALGGADSGGDKSAAANLALAELAKAREARLKQLQTKDEGYLAFSGAGRRIDGKKKGEEVNPSLQEASTAVAAAVRTSKKGKWKSKTQGSSFAGQGNTLS